MQNLIIIKSATKYERLIYDDAYVFYVKFALASHTCSFIECDKEREVSPAVTQYHAMQFMFVQYHSISDRGRNTFLKLKTGDRTVA